MISVEIDARDIERVITKLGATHVQVQRALASTLRKMASWVKTRSIKGLSEKLQIQQKVIRRRLRAIRAKRTTNGGAEVRIWYGLNPISLIYLGAKQNKRRGGGVRASGGRTVKGAFIAQMPGGGKGVFKRTGSSRLPIEKQSADIQSDAEHFLDDGLLNSPEFESQFYKTLTHELKWQTR